MDENIRRSIELGVAFMIFVLGLGLFFTYQQTMDSFLMTAMDYEHEEQRYDSIASGSSALAASRATEQVGKETLYYVLTNDNQIKVFINGNEVTKLRDRDDGYDGLLEIKGLLDGLTNSSFEADYLVDGDGTVLAVYYNGI